MEKKERSVEKCPYCKMAAAHLWVITTIAMLWKKLFHLGLVTFDKNKSTGVFIKTDKYTEIRWQ